jgi:hypothetical protein
VFLVDRITTIAWRLRRLLATETNLFQEYRKETYTRKATSLGDVMLCDHGDRFTRLFRYETTLERSLYKALHELQRLQAARAGQPVSPPAVVDVDVSVSTSREMSAP